ncbi:rRNA maturation RNase YbeY [Flammeovirgaceae bacterium SG7u.132]|nr:rRNA maturation RNase YbeY [Flammeovirgaceae bacterium SG7u.132]
MLYEHISLTKNGKYLFFCEDITFELKNQEKAVSWINKVSEQHNHQIEELNYIFCSDDYLLKINIDYLSHDTLTDIITFDNSETEGKIIGDIFISIDRVTENAGTFQNTFETELARVMIHGVLHLLGFKDKTKTEAQLMTEKENESLNALMKT